MAVCGSKMNTYLGCIWRAEWKNGCAYTKPVDVFDDCPRPIRFESVAPSYRSETSEDMSDIEWEVDGDDPAGMLPEEPGFGQDAPPADVPMDPGAEQDMAIDGHGNDDNDGRQGAKARCRSSRCHLVEGSRAGTGDKGVGAAHGCGRMAWRSDRAQTLTLGAVVTLLPPIAVLINITITINFIFLPLITAWVDLRYSVSTTSSG